MSRGAVCKGDRMTDRTKGDRKSTRLNSSHANISYAVFCLKKKKNTNELQSREHTEVADLNRITTQMATMVSGQFVSLDRKEVSQPMSRETAEVSAHRRYR